MMFKKKNKENRVLIEISEQEYEDFEKYRKQKVIDYDKKVKELEEIIEKEPYIVEHLIKNNNDFKYVLCERQIYKTEIYYEKLDGEPYILDVELATLDRLEDVYLFIEHYEAKDIIITRKEIGKV